MFCSCAVAKLFLLSYKMLIILYFHRYQRHHRYVSRVITKAIASKFRSSVHSHRWRPVFVNIEHIPRMVSCFMYWFFDIFYSSDLHACCILGYIEYIRCELLRSMISASVRKSVFLSRDRLCKTAERIDVLFSVETHEDPRSIVLDTVHILPRRGRGDSMRPCQNTLAICFK